MLKKSPKETKKVEVDIVALVSEYSSILEKEKVLKTQKDKLSAQIKDFASKNAQKDSNGNMYCRGNGFVYGQTCRKSVSIDFDKAKTFLTERDLWDRVVSIKESVDEDKVADLIKEEALTIEDLELITAVKETYAVYVKAETAAPAPDIQNTKLK